MHVIVFVTPKAFKRVAISWDLAITMHSSILGVYHMTVT